MDESNSGPSKNSMGRKLMNNALQSKSNDQGTSCEGSSSERENRATAEWIHDQIYGRFECDGFLLLMYYKKMNLAKLSYRIRCALKHDEVDYLERVAEAAFINHSISTMIRSLINVTPLSSWGGTSTLLDARWHSSEVALCTFLCRSTLPREKLLAIKLSPILRALYREAQIEKMAARRALASSRLGQDYDVSELTPRELEVLKWVWEGKTNPEVAVILGCSVNTVKTHLQRIFEKLGEYSRVRAARKVWGKERQATSAKIVA